ncbi:MAG: hypothetical protein ABWZ99_00220, partial [Ilumatobacteraceae bacterium]
MAAAALEQSILESKDKDTLLEMAKALGVKVNARLKKGEIIDKILDTTGSGSPSPSPAPAARDEDRTNSSNGSNGADVSDGADDADVPSHADPDSGAASVSAASDDDADLSADLVATPVASSTHDRTQPEVVLGADGEPLADWEIALLAEGGADDAPTSVTDDATSRGGDQGRNGNQPRHNDGNRNRNDGNRNRNEGQPRNEGGPTRTDSPGQGAPSQNNQNRNAQNRNEPDGQDGDGNRRRRRRRKGRSGQEGPQGEDVELIETDDLSSQPLESIDVEGYLDIRDEGYGFLRVKGYLPSKDDAYIPLRLAKQYGLRKGDHLTGKVRPAGRNEKNPGLLEVYTVNGANPELAKRRPNFEDLTALFPDSRLTLEDKSDPTNMTARIIDLVSPIGKGQRGIIVSPPKAGKTTVMKTIAKSIELNNPEVVLIVLLIDERPE